MGTSGAAGERGSRGRGRVGGARGAGANGNGLRNGNGHANVNGPRAERGVGGAGGASGQADRGGQAAGAQAAGAPGPMPPEPLPGSSEPADLEAAAPDFEAPPLPEEARSRAVASAAEPTVPVEAGPAGRLHVRFGAGIAPEVLQTAMATVRDLLRSRPGGTRVTVHLPQGHGRPALPMELRSGVAYDAELVMDVGRRLRPEICRLELVLQDDALGASA